MRTWISLLRILGPVVVCWTLTGCENTVPSNALRNGTSTETALLVTDTERRGHQRFGATGSNDTTSLFWGTWKLITIERHNAEGELLPTGTSDRIGYLMYDPAGYMGVVLQTRGRKTDTSKLEHLTSSEDLTPEEALEAFRTYTSYFGTFTVDEIAGEITHHLNGSLDPRGPGSDYVRKFEFSGDLITLQPLVGPAGIQSRLTWQRVPDLPELTPEYQRFIGFWEIDSIERRTESGEPVPATQYDEGFLQYSASGHMAVHLMRPERRPSEAAQRTGEEALAAMRTYTSYFGPVSLHETDGYIVHHRIGHANPSAIGTDAQRFYELIDNQLILKPPPTTVDGKLLQSALTWTRISQ